MNYKDELETGTLHIRLLKYFYLYASEEELNQMDDEYVFDFELEDGIYTISFLDLKVKADDETTAFLKKYEKYDKDYKG
mgnify:CR=1 FL=1